ncbi:3-oxoacyl-[acyl-carrier-protein] synthase 3 B, chloroplastic [Glycine soja]|nr:3-oxoacyl-[acyl-carrier-protein] synthase 3 B, chloroplastic [Glycine soja]
MANASGFFSPSVPHFKVRVKPLTTAIGFSAKVVCVGNIEGAEKHASTVSPSSQSPIPRLVSKGCKLVGCGSAVPALQISNDDLSKMVDTNDEWISVRTGIRRRRVLSVSHGLESGNSLFPYARGGLRAVTLPHTFAKRGTAGIRLSLFMIIWQVEIEHLKRVKLSFMLHCLLYKPRKDNLTGLAVEAARKALEMAKVDPDDLDLILMCTSTPEDLFGSAPQIQKQLGCKANPLSYDITAACSGFVLGLISAACHIRGGGFNNVLVIGADALSRYVDWTDRGTCILFGDAAGAVLVQACNSEEDGLFGFDLHSDGSGQRHLNASIKENESNNALDSNGSVFGFPPKQSSYSCIQMNGKEVFRFAVRCVPQSIESALEKAGLPASSIDWLLLHQANQRIIDAVATRLELPSERVISNLANYGNTSAASIPLALDEAVRSGKVKAGQTIATAGFGAGLTWGSAIIRWG